MEKNPFEVNNKPKQNLFEVNNKPKKNQQLNKKDLEQIRKRRLKSIERLLGGTFICLFILTIFLIIDSGLKQDYESDPYKYLDKKIDESWTWNQDFLNPELPNTQLIENILFDDFTGEDYTLEIEYSDEDETGVTLDLSNIEPGIYTVYNSSNSGYVKYAFSEHKDDVVYTDAPVYNIPIMNGTEIQLHAADPGEIVQIDFVAQDDYIEHDVDHHVGLFITGKSLDDDIIYDNEYVTACYPDINDNKENDYTCVFKDNLMRPDVPGSFIFSSDY